MTPKSRKLWIYIRSQKVWKCLKESDEHLDWGFLSPPPSMVFYTFRRGKSRRELVFFGETQEEVRVLFNKKLEKEIRDRKETRVRLKKEILDLTSQLLA